MVFPSNFLIFPRSEMGVFHESRIVVGDVGVLALDVYQLIQGPSKVSPESIWL